MPFVTTRAFVYVTSAFAIALVIIFLIALLALPRPAWASENPQPVKSAAGKLLAENLDVSENSSLLGNTVDAIARKADQLENLTLPYDPALIAAVGNQTADGHMICCPAYACAYGDAIIEGIARDHSFYGCGCCTWPNWGGGNSSFRSLGSNEALLREAYDEIHAGRPTVIHVSGGWGEHWICLIGYRDASDPNQLTLDNFLALDPVYDNEIVASDGYSLYGDFCEHVSDAR